MVAMNEAQLKLALVYAGVHFFHAMDIRGVAQYCANGGILCRSRLREVDPELTQFWSDAEDEPRGVLTRVFGNLYDFGAIFARAGSSATPNIYGPVTFDFGSRVMDEMNDIVLTKESIVRLSDPWRLHAISDQAEVAEMLSGDDFRDPLAPAYQYTELSCSNEVISFNALERIIVDPIVVNGVDLVEFTRDIASPIWGWPSS